MRVWAFVRLGRLVVLRRCGPAPRAAGLGVLGVLSSRRAIRSLPIAGPIVVRAGGSIGVQSMSCARVAVLAFTFELVLYRTWCDPSADVRSMFSVSFGRGELALVLFFCRDLCMLGC